ncbi:unnamed protein product [Fusarium graminearum]|uniref:Uncharacterized protein n=1 Tax=Gibberella zeae TaxID=5518 RepID=A0A4U9FJG8_GIBZA|nr:unnamed protein product [Fusarium graminearum]CAF3461761.1 unnamed protein product [Fusarium graminearum]CAF3616164.1 unnamed protein product [Fusarium graminearum]CAG1972456.1 unnamed protein product [Fusarium graminearum]CAG1980760.1 unnamed protein product [Fusarium graminearum]
MPIVDQLAGYDSYSGLFILHPENFSDDLDRQALYFQKSSVSCFYLPLLFVDSGCWLLGHDVPELSVFRVAATSAAPAILLMNVSSFSAASLVKYIDSFVVQAQAFRTGKLITITWFKQ